jgi:RNA-directed DNA polymerase
VRCADDIVCGFEHEADATAFLVELKARMEAFALSLHPEKTRLIEFGRFALTNRKRRGLGKPETFTFLGFTLICGWDRRGWFLLIRKTRRDRMRARLKAIKDQLRRRIHEPIPDQGRWLAQVEATSPITLFRPTSYRSKHSDTMSSARGGELTRRSQRGRVNWEMMLRLATQWLPMPRILHPWPNDRFAVKHPRWEPSA